MSRFVEIIIIFVLLTVAGCKPFPRDSRGSLDEAKTTTLKVGAVESPPWINFDGDEVNGLEAELVKQFARSIGAEIEWTKGDEEGLMRLLEANVLHLLVGGIQADTPWQKHVALTNPHTEQQYVVCSNGGQPLPADLRGEHVGVLRGSFLAAEIRRKDASPLQLETLTNYRGLIAILTEDIPVYSCDDDFIQLATTQYVMAVTKGENALLMALEESLHAIK